MLVRRTSCGREARLQGLELELSEGEAAGIKSCSLQIDGEFAYGYLKGERVHRLSCASRPTTATRAGIPPLRFRVLGIRWSGRYDRDRDQG